MAMRRSFGGVKQPSSKLTVGREGVLPHSLGLRAVHPPKAALEVQPTTVAGAPTSTPKPDALRSKILPTRRKSNPSFKKF